MVIVPLMYKNKPFIWTMLPRCIFLYVLSKENNNIFLPIAYNNEIICITSPQYIGLRYRLVTRNTNTQCITNSTKQYIIIKQLKDYFTYVVHLYRYLKFYTMQTNVIGYPTRQRSIYIYIYIYIYICHR